MASPSVIINVGANAQGVYSEIVRQARRAEEVIKRTPLRLEVKNFGAIRGFTADIDRFDKSLTRMSAVIQTFGQSAAILFGVQRAMAGLVKATIDTEKRMAALNVVLNETNDNFKRFGAGLFDIAKQTGQSFTVVADAAQEFARQGLGVEETLKRTRDALILTRTTGLDAATAVSDLTATLNTFKKEAIDSTKVINTFRNVDTAFAVSAADLAEGIKRAGASAQDAKVSFNELNALITSLQQNTARGGSVIGNSLKSIFTRVQRGSTVEALEGIGVAVKDAEGNLRPTVQILKDLATNIQFLSDSQKASIKETVAGAYQINALSALLQDLSSQYSVYDQALSTATNTTNEAIVANERLNQTTAAMLNETLQNLTQFAAKVGEVSLQPFVKNALNAINNLFDEINNLSKDSVGAKIGEGLLQGLANFISGPGVSLVAAALFKISRLVFEGAAAQLKSVLTLSKENSNILENQRRIEAILKSQDPVVQSLIRGAKSRADLERIVFGEIEKQNRALLYQENLSRSLAVSGTRGPVRRTAASGYIPSMASEKMQVNAGVGGAPKGARPVVIPNFNFGGGKRESIVANSSEYIIPNFAGSGGSAIFNQDMVKQYGLPKGARKVMAQGYIPNMVKFVARGKGQKEFINSLRPFASNIDAALQLAEMAGGQVNNIEILSNLSSFLKGRGGKNSSTAGGFDPLTNNIGIKSNRGGRSGANTLIHEIGHAAFKGIGGRTLGNLSEAYDKSRRKGFTKGTNLGIDLSGYPTKEYFEENTVQAFAENLLRHRSEGQDVRKNLLYRYVRKLSRAGLGMAGGFVPNLAKLKFSNYRHPNTEKVGRKISLDTGSYVETSKNDDQLAIDFIQSKKKGDAFKLFNLTKKYAQKQGLNKIYSGSLIGQYSGRPSDKLKPITPELMLLSLIDKPAALEKIFPQIRYRQQKGMNTSGFFTFMDHAKSDTEPEVRQFKSLKQLKNIVKRISPEAFNTNMRSNSFGIDDLTTTFARGYNPLSESANREIAALMSQGFDKNTAAKSIRVGRHPNLASSGNPSGFGVYNTLQKQTSIGDALLDHRGENVRRAGIPNLAPNLPSTPVDAKYFGRQSLRTTLGTELPRFEQARFASLDSLRQYITNLSDSVKEVDQNRSKFSNAGQIIKEYNKRIALGVKEVERRSFAGNAGATRVKSDLQERYQEALFAQRRPQFEENAKRIFQDQERRDKLEAKKGKVNDFLFKASFAVPFAAAGLTSAFGGDNDRKKSIVNNLSSDLSLAATLPLLLGTGPLGIAAAAGYGSVKIGESFGRLRDEDRFQVDSRTKSLESKTNNFNENSQTFQKFQQTFAALADAKLEGNVTAITTMSESLADLSGKFSDSKLSNAARSALSSGGTPEEIQNSLGKVFKEFQDNAGRDVARNQLGLELFNRADSNRGGLFKSLQGIQLKNVDDVRDLAQKIAGSVDIQNLSAQQRERVSNGVTNPISTLQILDDIGLGDMSQELHRLGGITGAYNQTLASNIAAILDSKIKNEDLGKSYKALAITQTNAIKSAKSLSDTFLKGLSITNSRRNADVGRTIALAQDNLSDESSPTLKLLGEETIERAKVAQETERAIGELFEKGGGLVLEKLVEKVGSKGSKLTPESYIRSQLGGGNLEALLKSLEDLGGEENKRNAEEIKHTLREIAEKHNQELQFLDEMTSLQAERNAVQAGRQVVAGLGNKDLFSQFRLAFSSATRGPQLGSLSLLTKEKSERRFGIGQSGEESFIAREKAARRSRAENELNLFQARKNLGIEENFSANFLANTSKDPLAREDANRALRERAGKKRDELRPALLERNRELFERAGIDTVDSFLGSVDKKQFTFGTNKDPFQEIRKAISGGKTEDVPKLIQSIRTAIEARGRNIPGTRTETKDNLEKLDRFEKNLKDLSLQFLGKDQSQINRITEDQLDQLVGGKGNTPLEALGNISTRANEQLSELKLIANNGQILATQGGVMIDVLSALKDRLDIDGERSDFVNQSALAAQKVVDTENALIKFSQDKAKYAEELQKGAGQDPQGRIINNSLSGLNPNAPYSDAQYKQKLLERDQAKYQSLVSFGRERVNFAQSYGSSGEAIQQINRNEKAALLRDVQKQASPNGEIPVDVTKLKVLLENLDATITNNIQAKIDVNTNVQGQQEAIAQEIARAVNTALQEYHKKNFKNPQIQ